MVSSCYYANDTGAHHLFVRTQTNGSRIYLLIVDNTWVNGKVKQRVLHRLGRLDELVASGQLDSLLQSLGRFSEKLSVLGAHLNGDSVTTRSARIGPALIGQRLWQACSIDKVLLALLRERHFEFSVERAIFLSVLHRLFAPGSDRAAAAKLSHLVDLQPYARTMHGSSSAGSTSSRNLKLRPEACLRTIFRPCAPRRKPLSQSRGSTWPSRNRCYTRNCGAV